MNERDRELLARVGRFNTNLGTVIVELMHRQDGGALPTDGLRMLADHLDALATLAANFRARAAEIDGRVSETPPTTVLDGATDG